MIDHNEKNLKNSRLNKKKNKGDKFHSMITTLWHEVVPETSSFEVCRMYQATHVIFSVRDLDLAGEDSNGIQANKIYKLHIFDQTGDFYIIDENKEQRIGFDLFIPCEFLKPINTSQVAQDENNVVSMQAYKDWKKIKRTI